MPLLPAPQPPDWAVDWSTFDPLPWLAAMRGCPQNPVRHAEGDVWTHVHMVCEAMTRLPAWRALPEADRDLLFTAALLHDVAKPACTRVEADGTVTSRGHAWKGAVRARQILWRRGVPFALREQVAGLIRHHLVPFFLAESVDPHRLAVEVSQSARCDLLAILAEADARGRTCPDPEHLLKQVDRFRAQCEASGCVGAAFPFETDHERFKFFHAAEVPPEPAPVEPGELVLMSGLPGVGKDYWIKLHAPEHPVVAIDQIRLDLNIAPSAPQGPVIARARELARGYLAKGQAFVWNAPNLSRHVRSECVKLAREFGASIRIVYVEVPAERLFVQNRSRRRKVPEPVIERMLDRWEVPDSTEAHLIEYVIVS